MSIENYIVADSGGSGTSWAFCKSDGSVNYLKTKSLHPKFTHSWIPEDWQQLKKTFIEEELNGPLFFYGSGCSQPSIQERMKHDLNTLGFSISEVYPDTLAACRATCGTSKGLVAILGTGSVMLEYDGVNIVNRIGGYGNLIGDEGSGFYFARLVLRDYLTNNSLLESSIRTQLAETIGTKEDVLAQLASASAIEWISSLSEKWAHIELNTYHERNLIEWLNEVLPSLQTDTKKLSVIGSYGFYQKNLLNNLLEQRSMTLGSVIQNPLPQLVDFHRSII